MTDLTTCSRVLEWAAEYSPDTHVPSDGEKAKALARAMRMAAVWSAHAEKLADLTTPQRWAKTNRETLAKAIRAALHDMRRAEEEP